MVIYDQVRKIAKFDRVTSQENMKSKTTLGLHIWPYTINYIWCIPAEPNPLSGLYFLFFFKLCYLLALHYKMSYTKFQIFNYFFHWFILESIFFNFDLKNFRAVKRCISLNKQFAYYSISIGNFLRFKKKIEPFLQNKKSSCFLRKP